MNKDARAIAEEIKKIIKAERKGPTVRGVKFLRDNSFQAMNFYNQFFPDCSKEAYCGALELLIKEGFIDKNLTDSGICFLTDEAN